MMCEVVCSHQNKMKLDEEELYFSSESMNATQMLREQNEVSTIKIANADKDFAPTIPLRRSSSIRKTSSWSFSVHPNIGKDTYNGDSSNRFNHTNHGAQSTKPKIKFLDGRMLKNNEMLRQFANLSSLEASQNDDENDDNLKQANCSSMDGQGTSSAFYKRINGQCVNASDQNNLQSSLREDSCRDRLEQLKQYVENTKSRRSSTQKGVNWSRHFERLTVQLENDRLTDATPELHPYSAERSDIGSSFNSTEDSDNKFADYGNEEKKYLRWKENFQNGADYIDDREGGMDNDVVIDVGDTDDDSIESELTMDEWELRGRSLRLSQRFSSITIDETMRQEIFAGIDCVSFKDVQVRYLETVLDNNPSCSRGPPIAFGWTVLGEETMSIGEWEDEKVHVRSASELRISPKDRENLLKSKGWTQRQIANAVRSVRKAKSRRKQTIVNLKTSGVEEIVESAASKVKNVLKFGKVRGFVKR